MSETVSEGSSSPSFLRLPRYSRDDLRSPSQAVLHALPPFVFFVINIWMVGMGLVYFIVSALPVPLPVVTFLFVAVAIPCALLSWFIFVRCVEVEAMLAV